MGSLSVVIERGRCRWGRCYFCGWGRRTRLISIDELKKIFRKSIAKRKNEDTLKIFCSGSFLDDLQFPPEFRRFCLEEAKRAGFSRVIVESRPEFITQENLEHLLEVEIDVTIAIGLELADDNILLNYYCKGFRVADYLKAVKILREYNTGVRTYVLINGHPVLYNNRDYHRKILNYTLELATKISDSVVVINAYPHEESNLIRDWIIQRWRPLSRKEFFELIGEWAKHPKIEMDLSNFNFIPRIPRRVHQYIRGVGREVLLHPHFEVWQDYIVNYYEPPLGKEYLLFLPCTYRKPYYLSRTHRAILSTLRKYGWFSKLHLVVVSTPGVVPYEFQHLYPFTSYDWPEWEESEDVKRDYIEITYLRVKRFLERHGARYRKIFAYFHLESETLRAIELAIRELNLQHKFVNVLDWDTYEQIKRELGKERVGSSVLRHRLALSKLEETLDRHLSLDLNKDNV